MFKRKSLSCALTAAFSALILLLSGLTLPAQAAPKKQMEITIKTLFVGSSTYALGVGLAELINKNSTWLKANAIEGPGPAVYLATIGKEPLETRRSTIFFNSWATQAMAIAGIGETKDVDYDFRRFKNIMFLGFGVYSFCTIDPKIRTIFDLKGKKITIGRNPEAGFAVRFMAILKEAGITKDDVRIEYMHEITAAPSALRDHLVDAGVATLGMASPPPKPSYRGSPWVTELAAMKNLHLISFPREYVLRAEKATGLSMNPIKIPPQLLPTKQSEPWEALSNYMLWGVHEDVPDEVVTEVLRIAYDNAEKFGKYNPRGRVIAKETMPFMGCPENLVHPAALKFYEDKGLSVGMFE